VNIALKYSFFASVATLTNILSQYVSLLIYGGRFSLYIAMAVGTLTGLFVKYVLDKKYIFYFQVDSAAKDTVKFLLYSFMGVFTTLIFWGTELAFDSLFRSEYAKFIGALIGLCFGYWTKFHLDKRFVFIQ